MLIVFRRVESVDQDREELSQRVPLGVRRRQESLELEDQRRDRT
jgi:hypothetical protein